MARHRAGPMTIFAVAIAVALVTAVNSQDLDPTVIISIQNNFPTYNLTVECRSDVPTRVQPHLLPPKDVYMFHFNRKLERPWTCQFSTGQPGNICGGLYRGQFLVWQRDHAATPLLCSSKCLWFVDASGLSLIQHSGGKPVHIYDWPTHAC